MKLRSKLILALFALAVVPLTVLTLYSYHSSIEAFRRAVQTESNSLARDMGYRMERVQRDLDRKIQRLGRFPFARLLRSRGPDARPEKDPLLASLISEIGDDIGVLDSLEFIPAPPPGRFGPPPLGVPPGPPPQGETPAQTRDGLFLQLGSRGRPPETDPRAWGPRDRPNARARKDRRLVLDILARLDALPPHLRPELDTSIETASVRNKFPNLPQLGERESSPQGAGEPKGETRHRAYAAAIAELRRRSEEHAAQASASATKASVVDSDVVSDGNLVGTVRAEVSPRQVLARVLSQTQRQQSEIPFAVDEEGNIHTADPKDLETLSAIPVSLDSLGEMGNTAVEEIENWVVVTQRDNESKVTFGIARPIGGSLGDIQFTAIRNLGFGLGVVVVAMVGIVPISNRMSRNLATLTAGARKLAQGDLETRVQVQSKDEFGQLAEAFNGMARDLGENQKRLVEQERLNQELDMCRKIQSEMLPNQPLLSEFVEIKGISMPARAVGGDFFNYFPFPGGDVAVLVGDVSGKGLPAALLMANLQAQLQAKLPLDEDLAQLATQLDQEIYSSTPAEAYLTLFMAVLRVKTATLSYVNAGHNAPVFLANGGSRLLESTGRPLGLLPGGSYRQESVSLSRGDGVFLFTDGLVEMENAAGEEFGASRLESMLVEMGSMDPGQWLIQVEEAVRLHRGATEALDDATLLVLKVRTV